MQNIKAILAEWNCLYLPIIVGPQCGGLGISTMTAASSSTFLDWGSAMEKSGGQPRGGGHPAHFLTDDQKDRLLQIAMGHLEHGAVSIFNEARRSFDENMVYGFRIITGIEYLTDVAKAVDEITGFVEQLSRPGVFKRGDFEITVPLIVNFILGEEVLRVPPRNLNSAENEIREALRKMASRGESDPLRGVVRELLSKSRRLAPPLIRG